MNADTDFGEQLTVEEGNVLDVPQAAVRAVDVRIEHGAELRGGGSVRADDLMFTSGEIIAEDDRALTLEAARFNLDGTDIDGRRSHFYAEQGDIRLVHLGGSPFLTDRFGGTISVGEGRHFSADADWSVGRNREIELDGGFGEGNEATLQAPSAFSGGVGDVQLEGELVATGRAVIGGGELHVQPDGSLEVPDSGDRLTVNDLRLTETRIEGEGRLVQDGKMTVDGLGKSAIDTSLEVTGNGSVDVDATLNLNARTVLDGGTITGTGTVVQNHSESTDLHVIINATPAIVNNARVYSPAFSSEAAIG